MWLIILSIILFILLILGARWFFSPIISSYYDPPALSYQHTYYDPNTKKSYPFPSLLSSQQHEHQQHQQQKQRSHNTNNNTTSSSSIYLSLIIPAYNEASRIAIMLDETLSYLNTRQSKDKSFTYELIIVDDGSRDDTYDRALSYSANYGVDKIRVLKLAVNQGKGGAVQQGMLHSRGQYLLMVDADGATKIEDVELLEQAIKETSSGYSIAVGSRAHLQEQAISQRSILRNFLMYGFHFLVSSLCVHSIRDTQCGFKLFPHDIAAIIFPQQHIRRWCFDVELLYIAQSLSIPIKEIAVHWQEIPGSKIKIIESSILMGRDLIVIRLAYLCRIWQMYTTTTKTTTTTIHNKQQSNK